VHTKDDSRGQKDEGWPSGQRLRDGGGRGGKRVHQIFGDGSYLCTCVATCPTRGGADQASAFRVQPPPGKAPTV
jgi:hypothetical protein